MKKRIMLAVTTLSGLLIGRVSPLKGMKLVLFVATLLFPLQLFAATLTLTWTDGSTNETNFNIDRKITDIGAFGPFGTVGANVEIFVDNTTMIGTKYCYRIQAANSAGVSAWSNIACGTPQVMPPDGAPTGAVVIQTNTTTVINPGP